MIKRVSRYEPSVLQINYSAPRTAITRRVSTPHRSADWGTGVPPGRCLLGLHGGPAKAQGWRSVSDPNIKSVMMATVQRYLGSASQHALAFEGHVMPKVAQLLGNSQAARGKAPPFLVAHPCLWSVGRCPDGGLGVRGRLDRATASSWLRRGCSEDRLGPSLARAPYRS